MSNKNTPQKRIKIFIKKNQKNPLNSDFITTKLRQNIV